MKTRRKSTKLMAICAAKTLPICLTAILIAGLRLFFPLWAEAAIPQQERDALIALYKSTNGANWTNKTGWLCTSGTECQWYGVTCDATQSSIVVLNLRSNQLSGTIPADELSSLTTLRSLFLSGNQLSGRVPIELGSLKGLYGLDLSSNQLSGTIPAELGSLVELATLALAFNQLTGPIPQQLAGLTLLNYVDLRGNQLSGPIPAWIDSLKYLENLLLSENHLSGPIPPQIGNLQWLWQLKLERNQLSGNIPTELANTGREGVWWRNKDGNLPDLAIQHNALYTTNSTLGSFLNARDAFWLGTQTVAPSGITGTPQSDSSAVVAWTPIPFTAHEGRYEVWSSTVRGGPYLLSGSSSDKSSSSLTLTGLTPGRTYYLVVRTVTEPNDDNQNRVASEFSPEISIATGPKMSLDLTIGRGGAANAATVGGQGPTQAGYAVVAVNSGAALYGTAVFSFKQNGVIVSEVGVPASPPTTSARIFVDYRTGVEIPGSAGRVDIYTGLAVVNRGAGTATITYILRDLDGETITIGTGTLTKDAHVAKFIAQLPDILSSFSIPSSFPTSIRFGTLELISSQPLSVLALRLTTNQSGETLLTSTPVVDLTRPPGTGPIYFPQFVDGGGYTTSVILLNASGVTEWGTLRLFADDGSPLSARLVSGAFGSSFAYEIQPGGAAVFQTDASLTDANVGWVEVTPDLWSPTPVGAGLFQYSQGKRLITESGIPAAMATTHARIYVDTYDGHDTGLAIGNPGLASLGVTLTAFQLDGSRPMGTSLGPVDLAGKGHSASFVGQRISGLPADFRGVLDIASTSPFVPLTLRALVNARGDFLLTTFPVADLNVPAPGLIIFPQIADGGGSITEFILLSAGSAASASISFFGDAGAPLAVGK